MLGLFKRVSQQGSQQGPHHEVGGPAESRAWQHAGPWRTMPRKRVGKVIPAAVVAAALAAGAVAYSLGGGGGAQAAQLADAAQRASLGSQAQVSIDGTGWAEAAGSGVIRVAKTASGSVARPATRPQASRSPQAVSESKPPMATAASTTPTKAAETPIAAATPTASATPTAAASSMPAASTLSCNLSSDLLPDNVTAIVSFLLVNGYSDNAAAGIAGNMYQESTGNPESEGMGGGGLIGFTPLPAGYVTGNPSVDLQTQLSAVLTFNQQWASYLPALNAAATPADAADIYVTDFERAGIPAASNREASAEAVAEACGI